MLGQHTCSLCGVQVSDDLERVADLALAEITNRFETKAGDIPDHVLAKYFTDINRTIDRREDKEVEEESKPFDLMAELATLPLAHALRLAEEEVARLEAETDRVRDWIAAHAEGRPDVSVSSVEPSAVEPDDTAGGRAAEAG